MSHLLEDRYGKSCIRLMKVIRDDRGHRLMDWTLNILFRGDFESCFVRGDNSKILPTDTMKNTVYSLARVSTATCMEEFGLELTNYFLNGNPQVTEVSVEIDERAWRHAMIDQLEHPTTFLQDNQEVQSSCIVQQRGMAAEVNSGLKHLVILKTANSKFEGFIKDRLTTLREADDRLFGTEITCKWRYEVSEKAAFETDRREIRRVIISAFAEHNSLSVQHTLYAVADAILSRNSTVREITIAMPNRHCLLVDLAPFGQDNPNVIFVPTDEPHGYIEATLRR